MHLSALECIWRSWNWEFTLRCCCGIGILNSMKANWMKKGRWIDSMFPVAFPISMCIWNYGEEKTERTIKIKCLTKQYDSRWLSICVCSQCALLLYFYTILPILWCYFSCFWDSIIHISRSVMWRSIDNFNSNSASSIWC